MKTLKKYIYEVSSDTITAAINKVKDDITDLNGKFAASDFQDTEILAKLQKRAGQLKYFTSGLETAKEKEKEEAEKQEKKLIADAIKGTKGKLKTLISKYAKPINSDIEFTPIFLGIVQTYKNSTEKRHGMRGWTTSSPYYRFTDTPAPVHVYISVLTLDEKKLQTYYKKLGINDNGLCDEVKQLNSNIEQEFENMGWDVGKIYNAKDIVKTELPIKYMSFMLYNIKDIESVINIKDFEQLKKGSMSEYTGGYQPKYYDNYTLNAWKLN